jgi:hypothetical protein
VKGRNPRNSANSAWTANNLFRGPAEHLGQSVRPQGRFCDMLPAVRRQRSRDLHAFVVRLGLGRRIPKVNIHTRDFFFYVCHCRAYNMSVGNNSEPCLCLRVDLKPFEECSDDWELKQNVPIITQIRTPTCQEAKPSPRLHGIFNQVGKTLNMVQRAFNFGEDGSTSLQPPRPRCRIQSLGRFWTQWGR